MCLCGCASNRDDGKNNLVISDGGEVTMRIREPFGEDYYDINELKDMLQKEVSEYNTQAGESLIEVKKVELSDSKVADVEISFATGKDYGSFNNEDMFIGTGFQADVQGWNLSVILTGVNDSSETIGQSDLKQVSDETLLISGYSGTIYLPSKAKYISDNVSVLEDKKTIIRNAEDSGVMYVVY